MAATARKSTGFSMQDAMKDRKRHESYKLQAEKNGRRLLEVLERQGAMQLDAVSKSYAGKEKEWHRDCSNLVDLIRHDRAMDKKYHWNSDWQTQKRLLIGKVK